MKNRHTMFWNLMKVYLKKNHLLLFGLNDNLLEFFHSLRSVLKFILGYELYVFIGTFLQNIDWFCLKFFIFNRLLNKFSNSIIKTIKLLNHWNYMNYQLVMNMIPTKGFCTARSAKSTSTDLRLSFYKFNTNMQNTDYILLHIIYI